MRRFLFRCLQAWIFALCGGACLRAADASRTAPAAAAEEAEEDLAASRARAVRAADFAAAIASSREGLERALQASDRTGQATWLRRLATDHYFIGNLELAVDYARQLLALAEETNSNSNRSRAHRLLSEIHDTMRDFPGARQHAEQAMRFAELVRGPQIKAFAQTCLGRSALHAGEIAAARLHFAAALDYWKTRSPLNAALARRNLGEVDEAAGNFPAALAAYQGAEAELREVGHARAVARTASLIAGLLRKLGRVAESRAELERVAPLVAQIGSPEVSSEYAEELAQTLAALGDFRGAYAAQRRAAEAAEALGVLRAAVRSRDAAARAALALKQEAIDRLAREKRSREETLRRSEAELRATTAVLARERTLRWSVGGGIALVALALGAVVFAQRWRLRAEQRSLAETRRARAAADEASALKTRLLGIASHDLKAPLRAMIVRAELLRAAAAPASEAALTAEQMRLDGERLLRLVHDLLDVSALESGQFRLSFAPVEINALVRSVVASQRARAEQKELALDFFGTDEAITVRGDAARLEQAVGNLLDNALKFTPPGKAVRVSVLLRVGRVGVAIADEGPGLQPEDLARMFRPFETLSAQATAGESSSGLGLHIAHEIVQRHGGQIEVETAPRAGALFTLVLPLAVDATAPAG
jgi:signal transduction histidine kinase